MKKSLILCLLVLLASGVCRLSSSASDIFAGSDTFVVTNAATGVIMATNAPTSGGAAVAWHPAGILANFRDSPTGAVLIVQHIRAGVVNAKVNATNTISVTNMLYSTNATGAVSAIVWDPTGVYTVNPPNDSLRITTSSTNAEIIFNKNVER